MTEDFSSLLTPADDSEEEGGDDDDGFMPLFTSALEVIDLAADLFRTIPEKDWLLLVRMAEYGQTAHYAINSGASMYAPEVWATLLPLFKGAMELLEFKLEEETEEVAVD